MILRTKPGFITFTCFNWIPLIEITNSYEDAVLNKGNQTSEPNPKNSKFYAEKKFTFPIFAPRQASRDFCLITKRKIPLKLRHAKK